ncbi:MAG: fused response regulator/phosphatase [Paracoccus sp. (in: a-proteobacteria)]|uniref:PP2C family protein-serine/threonine phosphatase n=1 Tax=Paracoccus sp. TaxID=267 RepID=UPI0026DF9E1D|nr:fused response regulator/phosphatase [Paracoccus sp. (in: a-proteobacteria)]MDO5621792.1 fused response regulator/phosphatase [Paracoccus sp. (in: a-proteobacteria)]
MTLTNRPLEASAPAPQQPRLVLVVDDSPAQRRVVTLQLARAGYQVTEASSGEEALRLCATQEPDFILSDWVMPGMSGPDFCRAFRGRKRKKYGYVILLTSRSGTQDIVHGLQSGADDFLAKPVATAELVARLAAGERILSMEERLRASNARLKETLEDLRRSQELIDRDLKDARALQEGLMRQRKGLMGQLSISLLLRPAGQIGGDLVGFFPIDSRRVGIFATDVSGHGVAAALLTARLAAYLSGAGEQNIALRMTPMGLYDALPPAELVSYLNRLLIKDMRTDTYLTMLYAEVNFLTGEGRLVQAGHPHPLIQRQNGSVEVVGHGGLPVGVFEGASYDEVPFRLAPGDRMFIASDGITEATSPHGTLLGEQGLMDILRTNASLHGDGLLESLSWSVSNFAQGRRDDDISAALLEYGGSGWPLGPGGKIPI